MSKPAVFLDRDGTIIEDVGFPNHPDQVRLIEGAVEGLRQLKQKGYLLLVISNQSGIARGYITPEQAEAVTQRFIETLQDEGVSIDGYYFCPHGPEDQCACRKPEPGMLQQAAREHDIDFSRSYIIGDRASDSAAGQRMGCKGILIVSRYETDPRAPRPDAIVNNWPEIVTYIQQDEKHHG